MLPKLIFISILSLSLAFTPSFQDVTTSAGIDIRPNGTRKLLKYGGPTIADLDLNGYYDLILVHHGSHSPEVYFNKGNGKFEKGDFRIKNDVHAITPFLLPKIKKFFFTIALGGNRGNRPQAPSVYQVLRNRDIVREDDRVGLNHWTARGRSVVFMPLRKNSTAPDALYLNADASPERCPGCTDGQYDAYAHTGGNPIYKPRILKGFKPTEHNDYGLAIDPDGDGKMKLLTWRNLTIHRITDNFEAKDVTRRYLGKLAYENGGAAAVEIDFDNDGDFDLYIARDKTGLRYSPKGNTYPDLLLENRGGRYVNVAAKAGIPQNIISRGVTAGDFNNDGWMDLYLTAFRGNDVLLMNNGDGTFRKVDIGIGKAGAAGDNALAVDYDNDGRVDLIRSEGDWGAQEDKGGQFRILKSVGSKDDGMGGFIKVRVGWTGTQTSQHAVVDVLVNDRRLRQRVGQAGVQTPHSYFDTLHFGIGKAKNVVVKVTWLNGEERIRRVEAGETAQFGRFDRRRRVQRSK